MRACMRVMEWVSYVFLFCVCKLKLSARMATSFFHLGENEIGIVERCRLHEDCKRNDATGWRNPAGQPGALVLAGLSHCSQPSSKAHPLADLSCADFLLQIPLKASLTQTL